MSRAPLYMGLLFIFANDINNYIPCHPEQREGSEDINYVHSDSSLRSE